jgi:hypothetical protein
MTLPTLTLATLDGTVSPIDAVLPIATRARARHRARDVVST